MAIPFAMLASMGMDLLNGPVGAPAKIQGGGGISMQPMIGPGGTNPESDSFPQAGQMGTGVPEATVAGASKMQEQIKKSSKGKKGKLDDKLQMAALAAQLGGLFAGGNAPPPPGAPRGGAMSFQPYQTPRDLFGG